MQSIKKTALVANGNGVEFRDNVNEWIDQYQKAGLEIEVQYQMSMNIFSAFIIARDKS